MSPDTLDDHSLDTWHFAVCVDVLSIPGTRDGRKTFLDVRRCPPRAGWVSEGEAAPSLFGRAPQLRTGTTTGIRGYADHTVLGLCHDRIPSCAATLPRHDGPHGAFRGVARRAHSLQGDTKIIFLLLLLLLLLLLFTADATATGICNASFAQNASTLVCFVGTACTLIEKCD